MRNFSKEGILNSFPDPETRVNFLNKFYQCLLAGKMPHKVRKLVVHGPKDPGKTSLINVLFGIIPMTDVASITQERQFAAAMIEEHTQLVVLDEWSEYTLQSDIAKSVLQGGVMVKSVKHKTAKRIENKALFYIATNQLPNFGSEDINVQRRIVCFKTSSLPNTCANADKWMKANCMHCIAWLISEIDKYKKLVDPDELWYEQNEHVEASDTELFNLDEIKSFKENDLKITSSEQEIKQLKAVLYDPENCLDESFQREAERIFHQKNAERQENQQKEIEMDIENMSGDDEDPNAQTYQRRIYEELRGNFYRPNLKPSYLNTARHQLEKRKNVDAEDYGWWLIIGKEHPDFDMCQFFERYPDAIRHVHRLRDLIKYRIVEWDTSKHFIDPVRRIEFKLNSEKSNSSEIKDNSSEKVKNQLQEKESMLEESESTVIPDVRNRIEIQTLKSKQWRGGREGGGGGPGPPSEKFLGALKSKGGPKIVNYQCEISYKICKVQLVNRFKVIVLLAFL